MSVSPVTSTSNIDQTQHSEIKRELDQAGALCALQAAMVALDTVKTEWEKEKTLSAPAKAPAPAAPASLDALCAPAAPASLGALC